MRLHPLLIGGRRSVESFVHSLLAGLLALACVAAGASSPYAARFSIPSQPMPDALDRFGEQSRLQVIYDPALIAGLRAPIVAGEMAPALALDQLLSGSGLQWAYVNENTVVIRANAEDQHDADHAAGHADDGSGQRTGVTRLSLIQVNEDPRRVLPNEASASAFGFDKQLLNTPRAASFISAEQIDLFGLSAVEDLVRFVPGVFTTTRFGIQGAVDVRNVPSDTYFRGMKRLTLQGHGRSVLAAMDTIEVVRGPPSPIDGLSKAGGFTNVVPKSGRARLGGYLKHEQGFAQVIYGGYDRREGSFGIGGPLAIAGKDGGYYTYALLEDSGSFTKNVPIRQKVLQTALSMENAVGPFRLETGANYQLSQTSGALLNRVTQDLIDHGRYIRGDPLALLDLNRNGSIGYLEYNTASPVLGNLSAGNQPLMQRWAWRNDANGNPLPLEQFPSVPGIPQTLYDYLVQACNAGPTNCPDPTGLLRAQGVGGPKPISGSVPIGFALDPRTVGYATLDSRRAGAFERAVEAEFFVGFLDLIYDDDPDFTVRNQMFVDSMDQFKVSEQPSGGKQDVLVLADKVTATYQWRNPPPWLRMNSLASLIFRNTHSTGQRYGADVGSHRTDVMSGSGGMTANTTFVHPYDNPNLQADGAPWTNLYDTDFWEAGAGLMFDIDLFDRTNLLIGGRIDESEAKNTNLAGRFDTNVGTSAMPGVYRLADDTARGSDHGTSWSISLSHEILPGVRPYTTVSRSSLMLDNNNNSMDNAVIRRGHIGSAELLEAGVKASLWNDKLFVSSAVYEQSRVDGAADEPSAVLGTDITHVTTRGWEMELKWVPAENLFLSLYGLAQKSVYTLDTGAAILVDARALGFQDVLDANGNVIYPAEAFLYGGRAFLVLPPGVGAYEEKQGNPNVQWGLHTSYKFANGFGVTFSGNYFSSVHSGRLRLVELPAASLVDAGVFWECGRWRFKLDVNNLLDERYFRARTGDTLGDTLVQAMPSRRWQLTAKYTF